ncbi:MAG: asparaginase, partial [Acidobacteriota bacterium]
MPNDFSRREFLASAAGGLAAAHTLGITHPLRPLRPLPRRAWAAAPVVISSANSLRPVQRAYELLVGGADPLDAIVEGVKIQELDPTDQSVGYGG